MNPLVGTFPGVFCQLSFRIRFDDTNSKNKNFFQTYDCKYALTILVFNWLFGKIFYDIL